MDGNFDWNGWLARELNRVRNGGDVAASNHQLLTALADDECDAEWVKEAFRQLMILKLKQ